MTKKEKKALALKLKAEIDARKPKPEKTEVISAEQMKRNSRKAYAKDKARTMKEAKTFRIKDNFRDNLEKW